MSEEGRGKGKGEGRMQLTPSKLGWAGLSLAALALLVSFILLRCVVLLCGVWWGVVGVSSEG